MKSMTGYGATTAKVGRGRLYIELKTVNHRYCEVSLRLPARMGALEAKLRECLQAKFQRGKLEVFVKELDSVFGPPELVLDVELAKQYQSALQRLQKSLKLQGKSDPLSLMGVQNFIQAKEKEGNYLNLWRDIQKLLILVVGQVEKMRHTEGAHLLADQKRRLKSLQALLKKIESRSQHNSKQRRSVFVTNPSNGNVETNLAPDKMDISEELTRLKSHAKQYENLLKQKEPVGRKLDFLIQEMHRETNTIGAKAADAEISGSVVDCKALLENLREQVQNVE
ncbi:MAG: YicC family protein [Deltaproteobacteria bacterium RIFCSPLOWO2_12_FULL_44_12]|nr:MAG: YicC family protein [Deltaproteobacteria bacterium RIFCSPHIGHO2_01_FULL_43_49]OGQ15710.1 MAG: YicC family protein [Deltaproteobacteria bacterium RIFCSPHIGHO2_02_FULL_44_53]OGQ28679.1 MAG: YicC family protein [Deltaproteobacteria bacterium RIFCSPHIGHO2_12_FULL_44_21]OGQ32002.1 MAG: YicC family protein [Deltaproteobacteria bacterium RIFCSPLOWO2_01_FULL_45_74]OGQ43615.1 MAG: YicC family protein [Deltaproteobacteria bacterium RIFCSPLOWO2_02_FULL_44_34]OGQ70170.1 MAG: YicC family protein [D